MYPIHCFSSKATRSISWSSLLSLFLTQAKSLPVGGTLPISPFQDNSDKGTMKELHNRMAGAVGMIPFDGRRYSRGKGFDNRWFLWLFTHQQNSGFSRTPVTKYLSIHQTHIWSRSEFNEICKVHYVNINLAEWLNSKIKKLKFLPVVDSIIARSQILTKCCQCTQCKV